MEIHRFIEIVSGILSFSRRKGDNVFLVAVYECLEYFALQSADENRLYCSKQQWIGTRPQCARTRAATAEGDDSDDFDEGEFKIVFLSTRLARLSRIFNFFSVFLTRFSLRRTKLGKHEIKFV